MLLFKRSSLDSNLFQLQWRPATTSLRYAFKFPFSKYRPLPYISLLLKFILSDFLKMRNEILISSVVAPNVYFLGPMSDPDPSNFIHQETNQIPFKQSVVDLPSWNTKTPFRNWPKIPKGWRDWFRRMSKKKGGDWELYDLNQCLTLSLS